ncbi:MAG: serine/threonine protein kinase, partial [Myxococcales bacterium]|nr:serine/threonine protein kinase [Myxococcales bacterium]
ERIHDQPTQQLPATRALSSSAGGTEDTRGSSATATTPVEALRAEEVVRTRMFLKICIVIVAAALIAAAIAGGDPVARLVVSAGCAIVALAAAWLLHVTRDPAKFTTQRLAITAVLVAIGAYGGVYYWGVVSPATAIIVYGIYFFSFGASAGATLGLYLFCAFLQIVVSTPVILGWVVDRSLIKTSQMSLREQLMSQAVVQFLYLCAYVTARAGRKTLLDAVEQLEKAVRAVSQREALLAEARAELDRALRVGGPGRYTDQVVGSYRLGLLLGRGGMGEVYEAVSVHDGTEAAVKLLHGGALSDPQQVKRFLRETEAAAKLDSPNVVAVLEVGTTTGEIPFLAMERLRGHDLAYHLRRRRKLALAQVVALVRQVGTGLRAARAAGIVHRDIKPHNLFLAEQGGVASWKILDFGVSKVGRSGTLTRGHVVGTPGYMAPEQARGDEVDWRADLYALAALAYRCTTGHPPFTGKDVPTTLYDVVYKMPTRPSILAEVPDDIDRVLAIGMAKQADDRFGDAEELADALVAAATGALPEGLRLRADALIERHPWGHRL